MERIKVAFDDNGITIPYPQMEVHMQQSAAQAAEDDGGAPADGGQPLAAKRL